MAWFLGVRNSVLKRGRIALSLNEDVTGGLVKRVFCRGCGWRHAPICLLDDLGHRRWWPYFRWVCDYHDRIILRGTEPPETTTP